MLGSEELALSLRTWVWFLDPMSKPVWYYDPRAGRQTWMCPWRWLLNWIWLARLTKFDNAFFLFFPSSFSSLDTEPVSWKYRSIPRRKQGATTSVILELGFSSVCFLETCRLLHHHLLSSPSVFFPPTSGSVWKLFVVSEYPVFHLCILKSISHLGKTMIGDRDVNPGTHLSDFLLHCIHSAFSIYYGGGRVLHYMVCMYVCVCGCVCIIFHIFKCLLVVFIKCSVYST